MTKINRPAHDDKELPSELDEEFAAGLRRMQRPGAAAKARQVMHHATPEDMARALTRSLAVERTKARSG